MSKYNVQNSHPIIPNANQYAYDRQYVSIHSEDRNVTKFPNSNEFEIELPQDYCNVQSIGLDSWTFPANYNTFSLLQNNVSLTFKIINPYNPIENGVTDPMDLIILTAMYGALISYNANSANGEYITIIDDGFYSPTDIQAELTNKMNQTVNVVILKYIQDNYSQTIYNEYVANYQYSQFIVAYNTVTQKLYFGNQSSNFIITNNSEFYLSPNIQDLLCTRQQYPEYSNWGLPPYLGFNRCNSEGIISTIDIPARFYHLFGADGYWVTPAETPYVNTSCYYLCAPFKINLMGLSHFYIELAGMNIIDETIPYALTNFTQTTNITNGVVKSSFAKISVVSTPITQFFDNLSSPIKVYNPPLNRLRRLKFKLRYHNGVLVDFGKYEFSLLLVFNLLTPLQAKNDCIVFDSNKGKS